MTLSIKEIEKLVSEYKKILKSNISTDYTRFIIDMNSDFQLTDNLHSMTRLLQHNKNQNTKYIEYKISSDCKTITFNNECFQIPNWYNKNMILIRDNKTLEMIFIGIISNKISKLQNYKSRFK